MSSNSTTLDEFTFTQHVYTTSNELQVLSNMVKSHVHDEKDSALLRESLSAPIIRARRSGIAFSHNFMISETNSPVPNLHIK